MLRFIIVTLALSSAVLRAGESDLDYLEKARESIVYEPDMLGLHPSFSRPVDFEQTKLEIDVERVQKLASSSKDDRVRYLACDVLAAVKEPSQLDFFISLADRKDEPIFWSNLSGLIATQVRTPADEKKVARFFKDDKLLPDIVWAARNTSDSELLKRILDPKPIQFKPVGINHLGNFMPSRIRDFLYYRLHHKIPTDPKLVEPVLKAICVRKHSGGGDGYHAAIIASRFGFPWAVQWFVNLLQQKPEQAPSQMKELGERSGLNMANEAIVCIQNLVKQDFGASKAKELIDPSSRIEEERAAVEGANQKHRPEIEAAINKCLAWWEQNSKDPRYQLKE